jgi:UDP-N-acetylglucosamine 2-epimerase (non-hydrolysing)
MMQAPILACVGTRPEVIKMAPVIEELTGRGATVVVLATGQHREMLDQALATFGLEPDFDLGLMEPGQCLAGLTARAVPALDSVIAEVGPRVVLVQGDTTTAMCGALAALYQRVPVGHVEAGLRTGVLTDPFPEEANRRVIGQLATWHFCPTPLSAENLLREGVSQSDVYVTGNTVIDAALTVAERCSLPDRRPRRDGRREVLVTMHRRESQGETQRQISKAIAQLANRGDVHVTFPVHLSPTVRASVLPVLGGHPHVTLSDPLEYEALIACLSRVDLVVTDSGGLQEEAPAFGVPVLVMRDTTERPEGIAAGCSLLCGADPERILAHAEELLDDSSVYGRMAAAGNPYGDGQAAVRIADTLLSVERNAAELHIHDDDGRSGPVARPADHDSTRQNEWAGIPETWDGAIVAARDSA